MVEKINLEQQFIDYLQSALPFRRHCQNLKVFYEKRLLPINNKMFFSMSFILRGEMWDSKKHFIKYQKR